MRFNFTRRFEKQREHLITSVRRNFSERLRLLSQEPFHPLLDNHLLHGEYAGCRSINITGDYRAIFYHEGPGTVRFIAIGTHHELFGS